MTNTASVAQKPLQTPEPTPNKKPKGFIVFGVLCIIASCALIPQTVYSTVVAAWSVFTDQAFSDDQIITSVLYIILVVSSIVITVAYMLLGIRLLRGLKRGARLTAEALIISLVAYMLVIMMLHGFEFDLIIPFAVTLVLISLLTYIDPSLSEERKLHRTLRQMEVRTEAEEGTLGLDETGQGFIRLDFFNLFWIFVIACILGDIIETIYHIAVVDPGHYEVRAGMLWGPFSPIYGFGAVLMTLALNRFHKASVIPIFVVSAIIGGAFEYFVSWFLQFAFGVTAWDYSGTFLNIGGRTNFMFMCMWGVLGVVWIKVCLPYMLKVVNLIPWQWRYGITLVAAAFMLLDGAMTLITLDCWYERLAGIPQETAVAQFCENHFDNAWMEQRFQSMSIDPSNATRA